jgi:hypothetical protein
LNTQHAEIPNRLHAIARTLRARRRLRLGVRAIWLALAVWCLGVIARLLGLPIAPNLLLGASGLTLLIAAAYAWFSQPSLTQLAHGLDDRYQLGQQLGTALEVTDRAEVNPLEDRLIQETDTLLVRIRRYFDSQPVVPWREIETFAALGLLAVGLWFATGPQLPDSLSPIALPTLPTPVAPTETAQQSQPTEQPVREEPPPPELSPEAQAAADAIADALRDNGATRSAADALDQGDTPGAARELRELADQAEQLSDQARRDLAEGLRDAAEQLGDSQPGLSSELEQQADALERGGAETAEALEDLARTVEQLGQDGQQAAEGEQGESGQSEQQGQGEQPGDQQGQASGGSSGAGNGLGGEQRGAQSGASEAQGESLPLPPSENTDGPTISATGPKGPNVQLEAGGTGSAQSNGGNSADQPLAGEADPLAIPSEYRDVVEDYFSPQP